MSPSFHPNHPGWGDVASPSRVHTLLGQRCGAATVQGDEIMTVMLPVGTRTCVPRLPTPWLRRPRLNRRISDLRSGDVMLVAAFAGSGKTTFLADWFTNDRLCDGAWLTLDARDNEPGRFAGLIAHALGLDAVAGSNAAVGRGDALVLDRVFEKLHARSRPAGTRPRRRARADRERVAAHARTSGAQRITRTRRWSFRRELTRRCRSGRLIVEGRLHQIRIDELALTPAEADALFDAHGLSLTNEQVTSLHDRTSGWAAGVRLAALGAGRRAAIPSRFVTDTVESDAVMSEYLMQEVLQRLPDDLQQFLLRTSVAQPLTVELATVLSDDADAEAKLAEFERAGLFVTRADRPVDGVPVPRAVRRVAARGAAPRRARARNARCRSRPRIWFDRARHADRGRAARVRRGRLVSSASSLACRRWVQSVLAVGRSAE